MKSYIKMAIAYLLGYFVCLTIVILDYNPILMGGIGGVLLVALDSIKTK